MNEQKNLWISIFHLKIMQKIKKKSVDVTIENFPELP